MVIATITATIAIRTTTSSPSSPPIKTLSTICCVKIGSAIWSAAAKSASAATKASLRRNGLKNWAIQAKFDSASGACSMPSP